MLGAVGSLLLFLFIAIWPVMFIAGAVAELRTAPRCRLCQRRMWGIEEESRKYKNLACGRHWNEMKRW